MNANHADKTDRKGFTLVETMIVLFIASIVMAGIFTVYTGQQKTYVDSDRVAEMQQNIRAAMLIMASEIREAGCDPTGNAGAGIVSAARSRIRLTRDIAGHALNPNQYDGDVDDANEDIEFGFSPAVDANADGIADAGAANLGRNTGGGFQPIAENIHAVEFNYVLADGTTTPTPNPSRLNDIRAVQISILARESAVDNKFLDTATYTTGSGNVWGPFNDNFKRRFMCTTIQCRNLGI